MNKYSAEIYKDTINKLRASRLARQVFLVTFDTLIVIFSYCIAFWLRLDAFFADTSYWARYSDLIYKSMPLLLIVRLACNWLWKQYNWSFSHAGALEAGRLFFSILSGSLVFGFINMSAQPFSESIPRSIYVFEFCLSLILMGGLRFTPKYAYNVYCGFARAHRPVEGRRPTLVYGAGGNAELLVRELERTNKHLYQIVGLIDDAPSKFHVYIAGLKVLGTMEDLSELIPKHGIKEILITIAEFSGGPLRRLMEICEPFGVSYKIVPPYQSMLSGHRDVLSTLEDVKPEALINRSPVPFEPKRLADFYRGRVALVTGAAGSIGSEICFQLVASGAARVILLDTNENGIFFLKDDLARASQKIKIDFEIGSVQDEALLRYVMRKYKPDIVLHAAAHKHVPLMEACPLAAIQNNVLGTMLTLQAAGEVGAEHFLLISTDKAVDPANVMGASKRLAELVTLSVNGSGLRTNIVRFGNVLGSNGSLLQIIQRQIVRGGPVTITDPKMTRFFMTIPEAIGLVLSTPTLVPRDIYVLDMGEAVSIDKLVRNLVSLSGLIPGGDIDIVYTKPRPGEKLVEMLVHADENMAVTEHPGIWFVSQDIPSLDFGRMRSDICGLPNTREDCLRLLRAYVAEYKPLTEQR